MKQNCSILTGDGNLTNPMITRSYDNLLMSIVVLSAPGNFKKRQRVREEFREVQETLERAYGKGVVLTFLLGLTDNIKDEAMIQYEQDHYGDVLRISVREGYKNLSYKTLTSYLWHDVVIRDRKLSIDFIVKTDDDVTVKWEQLTASLIRHGSVKSQIPHLYCHIVLKNRFPTREESDKL